MKEHKYTKNQMINEDFDIIKMLNTDVKRWTIYDSITKKFYDISDNDFNEGLQNDFIKLRGQYIQVENNQKIWVDGIVLK